jgi:hypothetical protein
MTFDARITPFRSTTVYAGKDDIKIPKYFLPHQPWIVRAIAYRRKLDMNTFILIVGGVRTGKSWTALKIAEILSKLFKQDFDLDNQLTFDDIKKFLMWSQKAEGSIFIMDETGTGLSTDSWFSLESRVMRRFCQTQGFRKNVLIWVLPNASFLQGSFRKMVNYVIVIKQRGIGLCYKWMADPIRSKDKYNYPSFIKKIRINRISPELERAYMNRKKDWNEKDLQKEINDLAWSMIEGGV